MPNNKWFSRNEEMSRAAEAVSQLPGPRAAQLAGEGARAAMEKALAYAKAADSANTRRAYRADWAHFVDWCMTARLPSLPATPETVAAYIADHAKTHAPSTLTRRLSAITRAHHTARHLDFSSSHPVVRATMRGIRKERGSGPRQAAAIGIAEIRRLVKTCDSGLAGARDRALLLIGFAAALRRSEIVAIEREHITFEATGLRLLLPRSKGDQEGQGTTLLIARGKQKETCPVRALEFWLEISAIKFGAVFRKVDQWGGIELHGLHHDAVRRILRRRAVKAGLDVEDLERLSPHGLRAGFITEAYRAGLRDEEIMEHSRHRDLKTMRRYVRRSRLAGESPSAKVGL